MLSKLRSLYTDPLYRNSLALMLNSAIGAFFGLLFWIVAARTMPAKEIGLATAAILAAALIVGLSKLGNYSEAYSRWRQGAPYRQRGLGIESLFKHQTDYV
ncbi:MAG: hypothetical protein Q8M95_08390 [Candidatus Methanoperedens sp.]|nr:hypothetical protein [Candidatus Methanoperedens sp.]